MNSPFNTPQRNPLPRNYAEIFDPKDYECKDSIELESYARNLHNYMMSLLEQPRFPEFLFDKLEKRLDGVTSILQKRSAASGVFNKDKAKKRLQELSERMDNAVVPPPVFLAPGSMYLDNKQPAKKRKIESPCISEVKKNMDSLRQLKRSYSDSQSTQPLDEEEED